LQLQFCNAFGRVNCFESASGDAHVAVDNRDESYRFAVNLDTDNRCRANVVVDDNEGFNFIR
jgi:hypothetical protein